MGLIIPTGTAGGSRSPLSIVSIFGGGVGGTVAAAAVVVSSAGGDDGGGGPVAVGSGGRGACCLRGKYGFDATCFFLKLKLKDSPLASLILSMESLETILMPSSMSMAVFLLLVPLLVLEQLAAALVLFQS